MFLVSVPFGVFGTVWAYLRLRRHRPRRPARLDWRGNVTFALGLIACSSASRTASSPTAGTRMGWTNPCVLAALVGGVAVLAVFA